MSEGKTLFVYGIFRPIEIGFPSIKNLVSKVEKANTKGRLFDKDGLLILVPSNSENQKQRQSEYKDQTISGFTLHISQENWDMAQVILKAIEPKDIYKETSISITLNKGEEQLQAIAYVARGNRPYTHPTVALQEQSDMGFTFSYFDNLSKQSSELYQLGNEKNQAFIYRPHTSFSGPHWKERIF